MSIISLLTIIIVLNIAVPGQTYDIERKVDDNELDKMLLETMKIVAKSDSKELCLKLEILTTLVILVAVVLIVCFYYIESKRIANRIERNLNISTSCWDKINNWLMEDHLEDDLNNQLLRQQTLIDSQRTEIDNLKNLVIPEIKSELDSKINQLNDQFNNLKSNSVPIGFIYLQLSGQSEPNTLWPNTQWENVSDKYSGLFFRAEGGQSTTFGQIQEQQTQTLHLYSNKYEYPKEDCRGEWLKINESEQERFLYTGDDNGHPVGLKFKHGNEEIRPQNKAVRIWKRTN